MTLIGYIDPGTGAIMMQVIAAGVIGVGIFFRRIVVLSLRCASKLFAQGTKDPPRNGEVVG